MVGETEGADINGDPLPGDTYFYLSPSVVAFRTEQDEEGIGEGIEPSH